MLPDHGPKFTAPLAHPSLLVSALPAAQVVVAPPAFHPQAMGLPGHDPSLTAELRAPPGVTEELPLGEDAARRVIAHRAMLEVEPGTRVVNLGVGVPEVSTPPSYCCFCGSRSL